MEESIKTAPFANDLLRRSEFADTLERFIFVEHEFVDGALVVTLDAPFGSGKTTFVEMWTKHLQARRDVKSALPRIVVINAWESDHCGDPLVSILAALKDALVEPSSPDPKPEIAEKLKEAAKDIGWFGVGLANSFLSDAVGIDPVAAGELAEKKKEVRTNQTFFPRSVLEIFEHRRDALKKLNSALRDGFGGGNVSALVVIDELDRCRPDYAVNYLETIKHVFNVHGMAFLLCVDAKQLESTTQVLFGDKTVFSEYYRKFSHRTVRLPDLEVEDYAALTRSYVDRYLSKAGWRATALSRDRGPIDRIKIVFSAMKLRPRQAQEVFRIFAHAFAKAEGDGRSANCVFASGVIFLSALQISNSVRYTKLVDPDCRPSDLTEIIRAVFGASREGHWWFQLLVSRLKRQGSWADEALAEMRKLGMVGGETTNVTNMLAQFLRDSEDEANFWTYVSRRIEQVRSFAEVDQ